METTNNYAAQGVQKLPNSNVTAQSLILVGIHQDANKSGTVFRKKITLKTKGTFSKMERISK